MKLVTKFALAFSLSSFVVLGGHAAISAGRAPGLPDLATAAVLAGVSALVAAGLGRFFIGGPLGRVVAQARRIAAGDLSQRLNESKTDEIGLLKRELNVMVDELLSARKRLEDEAASRVETLEQMRHLDRLRTVGTIASSIAHELGTPLNVLMLRGQSLSAGELAGDEVRETGRAILGQVEKMSRIVRQLLDFSRTRKSERVPLRPFDVASHASSLLATLAKKHGVSLALDTRSATDGRVLGDFGLLEQALTNLIVNGIHAMSTKGGVLRVGVVEREGEGDDRLGDAIVISVADEGDGIDDDARDSIFEPFFTTKGDGAGTGLGLSVARGIAEDHGGRIEVVSRPGQGSTFAIVLPRAS